MANPGVPVMPPRPAMPPGPTGPATTRPDSEGAKASGRLLASAALKALAMALPMLDPTSPEGVDVVNMLKIGGKRFGTPSGDLTRSEFKSLQERVSPMGTPDNPNAMKQAIQSKLGGLGVGGGQAAPPAAPPSPAPAMAAA